MNIDGYVIDIVRGDLLVEIQTKDFASVKAKLTAFCKDFKFGFDHYQLRGELLKLDKRTDHIIYQPIGTIHSPFKNLEGMPIQPSAAKGVKGHILINEQYLEGLSDLEGFSHLYLLYHFHLSQTFKLKVIPFLDNKFRGIFSTRAPKRPNPIGLSVVKLIKVNKTRLDIENLDILDGTPLLDIKPFVLEMHETSNYKIGWLSDHIKEMRSMLSDDRFYEK